MNAKIQRAVDGAALAPLSSEQRQELARLARRVWSAAGSALSFDDWRRRECLQTVERAGLRECRQEDYLPLQSHWLARLGCAGAARRLQARALMEPRAMALAKLASEMQAARGTLGDPEAYVGAIARCKFKTQDVRELGEKQLWTLVFDVRRAAQKKRRRGA